MLLVFTGFSFIRSWCAIWPGLTFTYMTVLVGSLARRLRSLQALWLLISISFISSIHCSRFPSDIKEIISLSVVRVSSLKGFLSNRVWYSGNRAAVSGVSPCTQLVLHYLGISALEQVLKISTKRSYSSGVGLIVWTVSSNILVNLGQFAFLKHYLLSNCIFCGQTGTLLVDVVYLGFETLFYNFVIKKERSGLFSRRHLPLLKDGRSLLSWMSAMWFDSAHTRTA